MLGFFRVYSRILTSIDTLPKPESRFRFLQLLQISYFPGPLPSLHILIFVLLVFPSPVFPVTTRITDDAMKSYLESNHTGLAQLNAPCLPLRNFPLVAADDASESSFSAKMNINLRGKAQDHNVKSLPY